MQYLHIQIEWNCTEKKFILLSSNKKKRMAIACIIILLLCFKARSHLHAVSDEKLLVH